MGENEKLVNMISELRKEKIALEMKIKQNEENSEVRNYFEYRVIEQEGRARLITFGQSINVLPPSEKNDDTLGKELEIQEQARRSEKL